MSGDLLHTKLYVPRPRPSLVSRPRLIERLDEGLGRKLTLISAPAGFGKTTLVTEWLAGGERPYAWLSLDERDGDLTRFLSYFVAALQTLALSDDRASTSAGIATLFGNRAQELLQSPQPPSTETILTVLLNEIAAVAEEFVLVLDDYHVLDSYAIDQALTFLLEHLPPQMHLVITTREDPNLPLARLRVGGLLTELRVADLRFTRDEAAVFFKQVMGLDLADENLSVLESRTEGWIAGLQLAGLSLHGRQHLKLKM
ncbi:MAG: AAA family ATPase [Candidatus Promineifilaceae bacterium]|nr:AAA family ATPase [Candidatus Promineifilaceae bacterium]